MHTPSLEAQHMLSLESVSLSLILTARCNDEEMILLNEVCLSPVHTETALLPVGHCEFSQNAKNDHKCDCLKYWVLRRTLTRICNILIHLHCTRYGWKLWIKMLCLLPTGLNWSTNVLLQSSTVLVICNCVTPFHYMFGHVWIRNHTLEAHKSTICIQ